MQIAQVDRKRVSLAAAISMILTGSQVAAQDTNKSAVEEVVVTGSFIRGTPEDAAMPVEVVSFEEIENMGRPSNLDLIKTMSESGGVAGENNRLNFFPIGAQTINLRSMGSRFTTVVFNGRRFPEQFSVNTGRFNNVAWIPNAAIGSVETLKAGGGATYGADAVAGVVNYITRKNFEGLELNADYRYIEDSDGDYNADMLWGKDFGAAGDLMVAFGYEHRSTLHTRDRDWYRYEYLENPQSWQFGGFPTSNPGSVVLQTSPTTTITPGGLVPGTGTSAANPPIIVPGASATQSQLQMGATGVLRDVGCNELGGFQSWTTTNSPGCFMNTAEMEDLVSKQDTFSLYLEHNVEVSDALRFHTEALLFRQEVPEISLGSTFTSNPAAWPLAPTGLQQQAVGSNAYFVSGQNPALRNLIENDLRNPNGTRALTDAQIAAIETAGRAALLNATWKPFGNGGTPRGSVDTQQSYQTMFRISEAIGGDLPEFWGTELEWEIGLTYSKTNDLKESDDILVDRLQAALNGFGGPNCTGTTPGANGCQWFNPFSSAIQRNVFTGATNPYYEAGLANSAELVDWLYVPISFKRVYKNYVVDPIIRGNTGIDLPGGPIAVAIGGQYRRQDERIYMDDYSNRAINPCPTLGVTNCQVSAQQGALVYNRQGNIFGAASNNFRPEGRHYPVAAGFVETRLPLLSNLDVNLAGRYEKFFSDVTDIDNDIFVPAASIKWQPLNWLGLRGSWGETFTQANKPRPRDPIVAVSAASTTYLGLGVQSGGTAYTTQNWANSDVEPEEGEYFDVGFIINAGDFQANVDYYNIKIDNYTRQMQSANVLDAVADPANARRPGPANTIALNCASAAFTQPINAMNGNPLVQLSNGRACAPGMTMADLAGSTVNFFGAVGQTNSGTLETSGVDLSARYRFAVGSGTITPSVDVSRILKWELSDFILNGVEVADGYDGLGYLNESSGRLTPRVSVSKYRANLGVIFNFGRHLVNLQAQYVPEIKNEDEALFGSASNKNANIGDANGVGGTAAPCTATGNLVANLGDVPANGGTGDAVATPTPINTTGARGFCANQNTRTEAGRVVDDWLNFDLIYRLELPGDTAASLVINNVLDEEPSFVRAIVPYNSAYGSPLGRTFKVGVTKRF